MRDNFCLLRYIDVSNQNIWSVPFGATHVEFSCFYLFESASISIEPFTKNRDSHTEFNLSTFNHVGALCAKYCHTFAEYLFAHNGCTYCTNKRSSKQKIIQLYQIEASQLIAVRFEK
jgi:hypothetical protein